LSSDDDVDRWTDQVIWDAVLKNIRIVISPYAVLLDALSHGFVTMQRLAICVFDEGMESNCLLVFNLTKTTAHHTKKKHPAKEIMQHFYFPAKSRGLPVPHIMGLSASPVVNAKVGGLE